MTVTATEVIHAPREKVWEIATDFDNIVENISAITAAEVLEKPQEGLKGLKWQETRIMFGKEATETMTISDVSDGYWYETKAENCGTIYTSRLELKEIQSDTEISLSFSGQPVSLYARLFSFMGFFFNGAIRKAFQADLSDIKRIAESGH